MKRFLAALAMTAATAAFAQDEEPYLWLEDVSGEKSMAWAWSRTRRAGP